MKLILFVDNSIRCFCLFRLSVAKEFVKRGFDVYILVPDKDEYFEHRIKNIGAKLILYKNSPNISPLSDLKLLLFFCKIYRELRPDYIVHYTIKPNIYGSIAARINSIQSLSVVPGTGSVFQKKGILSRIVLLLYKLAFRYPKKVWVLNQDDYNEFIKKKIVNPDSIEILPGEGIDSSYYKSRAEYNRHNPFVFLYMGRMLREKGVEYIAEASRLLKKRKYDNFEVHLLGLIDGLTKDIITEEEIKKWEKEDLVSFLGANNDVRENIENSDCILLPTFYGEGIPRSLMEASSMERMVIATNNVGCREIVVDGYNGLLCTSRDVEDLVEKMEYALNMSTEDLRKMGINGRRKILEEFEEYKIIAKYINEICG